MFYRNDLFHKVHQNKISVHPFTHFISENIQLVSLEFVIEGPNCSVIFQISVVLPKICGSKCS
jgi:hypothetical protein